MMSHDELHPGTHQIVVFDSIQTNVGSAYNNYSGIFTVPVSGVYSFSWSIADNGCHGAVYTVLVVNNVEVGGIGTDGSDVCDDELATGQVVLELNVGQIVFVRTDSTTPAQGAIRGRTFNRSTFSGFLLFWN